MFLGNTTPFLLPASPREKRERKGKRVPLAAELDLFTSTLLLETQFAPQSWTDEGREGAGCAAVPEPRASRPRLLCCLPSSCPGAPGTPLSKPYWPRIAGIVFPIPRRELPTTSQTPSPELGKKFSLAALYQGFDAIKNKYF